ncbi:MAG: adenylate cyclase [Rhodothermales bacterium]|jgi:adenylate cyclase
MVTHQAAALWAMRILNVISFFDELKRRNVVRVGVAYGVAAWVLLQVSDLILENIKAPDWVIQAMMLVVLIGFIAALVIAWAYELTPEGIRKEADVDRTQSLSPDTGRKLDRIITGFLVLAVAYFVYERQTMQPVAQIAKPVVIQQETVEVETSAEPSIAVLPFADMSPDKDQEYFSDGISEELLNLLVRVDGLKVASRTSSFAFKGSQLGLAEIANNLKVDHVLEGSIRKADNRVRITAQLIDAATDRHLWSDTYDRELTDIFGIQDEIANAIVDALRAELGMLESAEKITVEADTANINAYELYLRGRALFIARDRLEESIRLLEQAVEQDPGFARAWESLAAVYAVATAWGVYDRDYDSLALDAADQALALNPNLSMPWAVKAEETKLGWSTSLDYYQKAISNNPKNTTALLWRGIAWSNLGFNDKAISDVTACLEIDPYYENCRRHLALFILIKGDIDRAIELWDISAERGFAGSTENFAHVLIERDRRSTVALSMWIFGMERTFPMKLILDAVEFPERDHSTSVKRFLDWIDAQGESPEYWMDVLVLMRNYDHMQSDSDSYWNLWQWLDIHTEFRHSERFRKLYKEMGILSYWHEHGFPPQCRPVGEEDFECD